MKIATFVGNRMIKQYKILLRFLLHCGLTGLMGTLAWNKINGLMA